MSFSAYTKLAASKVNSIKSKKMSIQDQSHDPIYDNATHDKIVEVDNDATQEAAAAGGEEKPPEEDAADKAQEDAADKTKDGIIEKLRNVGRKRSRDGGRRKSRDAGHKRSKSHDKSSDSSKKGAKKHRSRKSTDTGQMSSLTAINNTDMPVMGLLEGYV